VRTGFFSDYTATAMMSDGSTQVVTTATTWTSSTAAATIASSGRLTGQSHGSTLVTATYQSRIASKTVTIVNNYGGSWNGSYVVAACDASGDFAKADWCTGVKGATYLLALSLTQTGNDRNQISGTLTNGFIRNAPVTGTVTSDGRLNIGSDAVGTSSGVSFHFQLLGWDTRLASLNQMSGRTAVSLSGLGLNGNAYEEHTIAGVILTSPQFAPVAEP
jgi:hypothetical protein